MNTLFCLKYIYIYLLNGDFHCINLEITGSWEVKEDRDIN